MNDIFTEWLSSGDVLPCCFQEKGFRYILIRVEKNADFEYLYSLNRERKDVPTRGSSFEYAGIYYRKDGLLYDAQYSLTSIEDDPEPLRSRRAEALQELLKAAVRKKVEAAVGNDRKNLRITELTDAALLNNLDYTVRHGAKAAARRLYLDTAEFEPPVFHCTYTPDRWTEDSLLAYIADPESYAEQQAEGFLAENQENMLLDFLSRDAVLKEYRDILENKENPVHTVKKIMDAMRTTSAKTVNVTVVKEGVEFTFKTEAATLRGDCTSYYSTWQIAAADRKKFEQTFGRNADYRPEDIRRITYARNVLYEAGR